jgi:hypothetical protein
MSIQGDRIQDQKQNQDQHQLRRTRVSALHTEQESGLEETCGNNGHGSGES